MGVRNPLAPAVAVLALMVLTAPAWAIPPGLTDHGDWTTVEATGLDYLDIDVTLGITFDDAAAGIIYAGRQWHLATYDQVRDLLSYWFWYLPVYNYAAMWQHPPGAAIYDFYATVGTTLIYYDDIEHITYTYAEAWTDWEYDDRPQGGGAGWWSVRNEFFGLEFYDETFLGIRCCWITTVSTTNGAWMVSPVPEPSRWLLLAAGLGCLGALSLVRLRGA